MTFQGFPAGLMPFLAELALRNERPWFEANRDRYERDVREPARAFVRSMGERLPSIAPHLVADDRKVGGSLMRIHRDTRFGKDKTPYKTNVGIQFRHSAGKDVHAPGLYVHLAPDMCFLGAGMWEPEPASLQAIRERIAAQPDLWAEILGEPALAAGFRQEGVRLSRPPRGYPADHPQAAELRRKSFIAVADLDPAALESPALVDHVAGQFAATRRYMSFLCEAVGQAY